MIQNTSLAGGLFCTSGAFCRLSLKTRRISSRRVLRTATIVIVILL